MNKETFLSCEENGPEGAERVAKLYRPGGEYYKPGMTVKIEHGQVPVFGSANPGPDFGKTEPGYKIIVSR
jgi:hypothetical protein